MGTMTTERIFDKLIKLLQDNPGQLRIKTCTNLLYGSDHTLSNYNYIQRFINDLQKKGQLTKDTDGKITLTSKRPTTPTPEKGFPFKLPIQFQTITAIQELIDNDKRLASAVASIKPNPLLFKEALIERADNSLNTSGLVLLMTELIIYMSMLMETSDNPSRFFEQVKSKGTIVDIDEILERFEHIMSIV